MASCAGEMISKRWIIFAPGIHTGGGLTLLRELIAAWPNEVPVSAILDSRAKDMLDIPSGWQTKWFQRTLLDAWRAERSLRRASRATDAILMFQSLPPMMKPKGRVVVYFHSPYLLDQPLSALPWKARLRVMVERFLFFRYHRRVDRFLVQTPSMIDRLEKALATRGTRSADIIVAPFAASIPVGMVPPSIETDRYDFVYVADGVPHKNHRVLIDAWKLLARDGLFPSLALTLPPRDSALICEIEAARDSHGLAIVNLGGIPHGDVIRLYRRAGALIFPSTLETLGLPLVEARAMGLPIVAAELDFVRDVCEPSETFDPASPRSIARAVRRRLGVPEAVVTPMDATQFCTYLLADAGSDRAGSL